MPARTGRSKFTTQEIREQRRKRTHGTIGGYVQHKYRKEEACASCKAAWRQYYQDRKIRKAEEAELESVSEYIARTQGQPVRDDDVSALPEEVEPELPSGFHVGGDQLGVERWNPGPRWA